MSLLDGVVQHAAASRALANTQLQAELGELCLDQPRFGD